ncbi:sensor histidine kinase [Streptomyces europaeiscabiei]|uniref:histidine kinase n=1 Tax=Streptomyces europaeiscabiei TaxID=146819 RepID=A0ABU4NSP6_9ACTN|nr:HAMP domain-containing sensor histidine kinase [Streptomyces europaeiscabiei]MDX2524674.1 HAMP domain-containing sensor histidine kinase [Streptomyces europaeiscabiei]MDX2769148.1 HAMP domain-containing sensor histidine kinase [Streptomyces europaeiscabiei]MDX3548504.1 HAMP domain-containing sensor histidine kinase [Streptomyces europaeiscabiei]MDX3558147.1 HAMP domain-containing sensor histidine kinase [Streptomyces europaeiscabiei]MDX3705976.1 HAMP domain-containing sensor histidine kinas
MNATEPRRRWWPHSVRARTALAAALAAAVVLVGIGWWVHQEVYRESMTIAEERAERNLAALVDQLRDGSVPGPRSAAPYEVVATGRRTAVASGGAMQDFDPRARHVLPAPPALSAPTRDDDDGWGYAMRPLRIPERRDYNPVYGYDLAGKTYLVLYNDIWAGELGKDKAAALGVTAGATLRAYVVVLPDTAEEIAGTTDDLLLRAGLVGLVLIAAIAYFTVRIALRPVEAIRVLTASVTASDPRERVTVPATGHEITALATTINSTLQRLDDAAAQQRRFVADAAHELRSPLTTLLASLEVALAYPERTDWPAAATTAARQTRRLQALAEDLLLLARLDTRTPIAGPDTVDLTALASRLTEQYPLTERPLTLTCDSTAPAHAHGNLDEYERLLRNLIDNAARHAAHRIQITIRNQDDWVVLTVHDDGPGVPAEDAERIFERFVRLDDARSRDQGGTGLGLAIARDLAHRHRGTLALTPRTLGACFQLRLPRAPSPAEE